MRLSAVLLVGTALLAQPVVAGDFGLSELRAGVMSHSADPFTVENLSRVQDVNFEALFTAPYLDMFTWLDGELRVSVGGTANFGGLESMAHVGLNWHVPIMDSPAWVELTLGGAIHNGALSGAVLPARDLGCRALFYEAGSIGVDVADNASIMLTLEHASSAELCHPNRGLTNLGVRAGVKF